MGREVSYVVCCFESFEYGSGNDVSGSDSALFFSFCGTSVTMPIVAEPLNNPINRIEASYTPNIVTYICCCFNLLMMVILAVVR